MHLAGGHLEQGQTPALTHRSWRGRVRLALLLCLGLAGAPAPAAVNIYVSIPGVPGESTDAGHVGWTSVQAWSHGMSTTVPPPSTHAPLTFAKPVDKGSPTLYADLCQATHLASAQMDLVRTGSTNIEFYQIKLSNVLVSEVDSSLSSDGGTETVSLSYLQVAWTYTTVDGKGNPNGTNSATWDLSANRGSSTNGPVVADSDGDGIPDWWMNQYFGHPTGLASDHNLANQDADSDGLSNWQEFIAGTNPTNANSVFRVSKINLGSGQVRVTWSSAAGKTYSLYGASSVNGPYSLIATGIGSAGYGETYYDLADSPTRQFFRVSVP